MQVVATAYGGPRKLSSPGPPTTLGRNKQTNIETHISSSGNTRGGSLTLTPIRVEVSLVGIQHRH